MTAFCFLLANLLIYFLIYWMFYNLFYCITLIFDWCIVTLQCCIFFRYTAKRFSYMYTHIHSFSDSFPILVITEYWIGFTMVYSRYFLAIYFIYSSSYMLIPTSWFIPPLTFPLWYHKLVLESVSVFLLLWWWFSFCFLGLYLWYMEVPRLGVIGAIATGLHQEMLDPSCICNPYQSSQQHHILNPLSRARDRTYVFMDTSLVHYHLSTTGTTCFCVKSVFCIILY